MKKIKNKENQANSSREQELTNWKKGLQKIKFKILIQHYVDNGFTFTEQKYYKELKYHGCTIEKQSTQLADVKNRK